MDYKSLEEYEIELERKERLDHRDVLLSIGSLIKSTEGQNLFKYLFKNLEVSQMPPQGLEGTQLHEYLGFLRAGNTIYKLACEAAPSEAASILAKLERERYDELYEQHRIANGLNTESNSE